MHTPATFALTLLELLTQIVKQTEGYNIIPYITENVWKLFMSFSFEDTAKSP